jgi:membrane protein implicated in regulation of membrane protease activity
VTAMLIGALVGALLLKTSLTLPLAAAAVLSLLTSLLYVPAAQREAQEIATKPRSPDDA